MNCRSVTAVASDLVLVELCGRQHFLSHNPLHFHLNFNKDLGGILSLGFMNAHSQVGQG